MDDAAFQAATPAKAARPGQPSLLGAALRVGAYTVWDNLARPVAKASGEVPYKIEAVSREWLSDVLCGESVGAEVTRFDFGVRTSGSTVRRRITLAYSGDRGNADLPATVFAAPETTHNKINADLGKPDDPATKALSEFLAAALKK